MSEVAKNSRRMRSLRAPDTSGGRWQKCPVCLGRGTVSCTFYPPHISTSTAPVKCRACGGKGIVK